MKPRLALLMLACWLASAQAAPSSPVQIVSLQADACDPAEGTPLLLDTLINGTLTGREALYRRAPCGGLFAPVADLAALRVAVFQRPTVLLDGQRYLRLDDIAGLSYRIDEEQARLVLEGEPQVFVPTVINLDGPPPPPPLPAATGALFNYGVFAFGGFDGGLPSQLLQNHQLTLFGPAGVLDSQVLLLDGPGGTQPFRVFTTATRDSVDALRSLRLGDVFSRGGAWGAVAPLGGLQIARNFALRPDLVTTPVTTLDLAVRRSAALSINGSSLFTDPAALGALYFGNLGAVPYGPVQVINLPAGSSNRRLRLRAQQLGGPPQVDLQPDFYSLGLLRGGFRDYSYELGFRRRDFLGDDYGTLVGAATERYGLSQRLTLETHAEASSTRQAGGVALAAAVPWVGVVETSLAASMRPRFSHLKPRASLAVSNVYEGFGYRLSFSKAARGFLLPTAASGTQAERQLQMALSSQLPGGTGFVSYATSRRESASSLAPTRSRFAFVGYSASFRQRLSLSVFAGRSLSTPRDTTVSAALSVPFTVFGGMGRGEYATQAQVAVNQDDRQDTRADLQLGRTLVRGDNRFNLEAAQSFMGSDYTALTGGWLHPRFSASAQLSRGVSGEAYSAGVAGAVAVIGGRVLATRPIGSSFALVRLGADYAGTHVNGMPSDAQGDVLLPELAAFVATPVQLDPRELPLSFQPESLDFSARAPFRSGVILQPKLALQRDALVRLQLREGRQLIDAPIGSFARIDGHEEDFPVGDGGLLYLYGIGDVTTLRFVSGPVSCLVKLVLPPAARRSATSLADIPELGPFVCEGAA